MVTDGASPMAWFGPRIFFSVVVAARMSSLREVLMTVILGLRGRFHIGRTEPIRAPDPLPRAPYPLPGRRACDRQRQGAIRAGLEPEHEPGSLPDEGRSGEQRGVLLDRPARRLVQVRVLAAGDVGAAAAGDLDRLHVGAAEQQLLEVLAADPAARLREDRAGVDPLERGQVVARRVDQRDPLAGDAD